MDTVMAGMLPERRGPGQPATGRGERNRQSRGGRRGGRCHRTFIELQSWRLYLRLGSHHHRQRLGGGLMKSGMTALAIGLAAFAFAANAQQITGAGATFPAPVYTKWGEAAKAATGIELNYQAIGSGGGQNQILNRTVDFGASDAPMDPAKLDSGKLLQFPTVMGAVVVIVNLPDIKADEIKLTGELLADIFDGKITKWNDPKLVELNKGVKLPSLAIAPVHRADGSGTTFVFTSYLSTVSP